MDNKIVEYIAEKISEITRKSPDADLTVFVCMPKTASERYPNFVIEVQPLLFAGCGEPKTFVKIV